MSFQSSSVKIVPGGDGYVSTAKADDVMTIRFTGDLVTIHADVRIDNG